MKAWGDPPIRRRDDPLFRCGTACGRTRAALDSPIDPGPAARRRPVGILDPRRASRTRTAGHSTVGHRCSATGWDASASRYATAGDEPPSSVRMRSRPGARPCSVSARAIGPQELTDPVIASAYRFARSRGVPVNVPRLLAAYAEAVDRADRPEGFPWAFEPGGGPGSPLSDGVGRRAGPLAAPRSRAAGCGLRRATLAGSSSRSPRSRSSSCWRRSPSRTTPRATRPGRSATPCSRRSRLASPCTSPPTTRGETCSRCGC